MGKEKPRRGCGGAARGPIVTRKCNMINKDKSKFADQKYRIQQLARTHTQGTLNDRLHLPSIFTTRFDINNKCTRAYLTRLFASPKNLFKGIKIGYKLFRRNGIEMNGRKIVRKLK